jgi:hypothetical protein
MLLLGNKLEIKCTFSATSVASHSELTETAAATSAEDLGGINSCDCKARSTSGVWQLDDAVQLVILTLRTGRNGLDGKCSNLHRIMI